MLVAGYTLLKIGFKHLKYSHVHYSLEHFLSLLVFFITFRFMAKYVKKKTTSNGGKSKLQILDSDDLLLQPPFF